MVEESVKNFIDACDELVDCKYLVAEYKIQKLLKALAESEPVCSLIGECLEQFNRDRELAKAYIQDGNGDFVYIAPAEEYKTIALVFCTLVDIDNKKIAFVDFIKRFFGREENPFQAFVFQMIVPFRNLIAEVFGLNKVTAPVITNEEEKEEDYQEKYENEDEEDEEDGEDDEFDPFAKSEQIAVQILTQLEFTKQDSNVMTIMQICRAIVKTSKLKDEDVLCSLIYALKTCKDKPVKYLIREMLDLLD